MVVSSAATRCVVIDNPSLPPSPSTLARPIADPALIDQDLFSSLRIIWGRHADPRGDKIKDDLCAPAGRGVHAKAFYFLLARYREETSKMNDTETTEIGAPSAALPSMTFNLGWGARHPDRRQHSQEIRRQKNFNHICRVFAAPDTIRCSSCLFGKAYSPAYATCCHNYSSRTTSVPCWTPYSHVR